MRHGTQEPLEKTKPASPTRPPGWLILDRFVHRSSRRPDAEDATASSTSHDCIGRPIRASLNVAGDPPAMSRLNLHWPESPSIRGMKEPVVIAAHGHAILFKATVPLKDPHDHAPCFFPIDYFVYSASSSSPPSLTRLPACFLGVDTEPDDRYFKPYRRQQQRVMLDRNMGILCHGEDGGGGEFTVADLTHRFDHDVELCVLHHPPPSSGINQGHQWSVERLRITPGMRAMGLDLFTFNSDAVVPIAGRFLAWVDYYQGMLLVDVLHENADHQHQLLRFIPMPEEALLSHQRLNVDEGCPDPARCVGVTDDGIVKLVCIISRRSSSHGFAIATWTLADIDRGVWEKHDSCSMDDREFFSIYEDVVAAESGLPRVQPSFPIVSLVDPDVVCFVLKEEKVNDIVWLVEINMRTKVLCSSSGAIHMNEEEARSYPFDGHSFISSKISSYLSE